MIVKKELVVSGRKKADIVSELRKRSFRPFPKVAKAKAAGETKEALEDVEVEEEETGATTDFDYLLAMPIYSLTTEKIEKLLEQGRQKETELLALLEKTPAELWNTDLDDFLSQWEVCNFRCELYYHELTHGYQKLCKDWEDAAVKDSNGKPVKRKQATLKTRKSLTGPFAKKKVSDGDSEDDFVPNKAAAKAAPKRAEPVARKVSKPKVKKVESDSEDDLYTKPSATERKIPRSNAVKKYIEEDSDAEDFKSGGMKAAANGTSVFDEIPRPAKKKTTAVKDESDVEIVDDSNAKGKMKPAMKRKR